MSEDNMALEQRNKTWQGFVRLMTLSGAATMIVLAILWATVY